MNHKIITSMRYHWLALLFLAGGLLSCSSPKKATSEPEPETVAIEYRDLDTLVVSAPRTKPDSGTAAKTYTLPDYNGSHTRRNDLLHTELDLRFDWEQEKVLGKATLKLKPFFYPVDQVTLDAKDFEFHQVRLAGAGQDLSYDYDGKMIVIQLDRTYQRNEEYTLYINYTASPSATGGSAAITSDQGLFFIKPDTDAPDKPMQIWTQGETEWNSRWFPTIDKPNERCTQEILLTVEDRFETLSNGVLVSSEKNPDGTRTDYWKMDQPHAPYLFMIAVGDYAIVKDQWEDISVSYYVEPEFEEDARAIFPHTVEMLDLFSDKLNLKYPWPKYDQVVVRDYVSGAMENTSAVIYGEFMQRPRRELIDERTNEKIVAHELFHHWFGDLVTCESWANLTMNEGFANYSEYLWLEHKYGPDEADFHLLNEWSGYLSEARSSLHPLIHFGYNSKEAMFDAHSYNKGGSVLHMLRNYVGDEAFWTALNRYLTEHAYSAVEVHDLRLAFEEVTGEDLNWFFNQWYLRQGHPLLNITYGYEEEGKRATLRVEQTQDPDRMPPIFQLPVAVDIYFENGEAPIRKQIRVTERNQDFAFQVEQEPELMIFDADRALLAETEENKTEDQLIFQYYNGPKFLDRFEAVQQLQDSDAPEARQMLEAALKDDFWVIRSVALSSVDPRGREDMLKTIREMAAADPHSQVRASALSTLAVLEDEPAIDIAVSAIETDSAYNVIAAGLDFLIQVDKETAMQYAQNLQDTESGSLLSTISTLYAESGDRKYLPFFQDKLKKVNGFDALSFFSNYQTLIAQFEAEESMAALEPVVKIGLDQQQSPWRRLAAMKALNDLRNEYRYEANQLEAEEAKQELENLVERVTKLMEQINAAESNNQLKNMYDSFQLLQRS